jgi:hypothetical protein
MLPRYRQEMPRGAKRAFLLPKDTQQTHAQDLQGVRFAKRWVVLRAKHVSRYCLKPQEDKGEQSVLRLVVPSSRLTQELFQFFATRLPWLTHGCHSPLR